MRKYLLLVLLTLIILSCNKYYSEAIRDIKRNKVSDQTYLTLKLATNENEKKYDSYYELSLLYFSNITDNSMLNLAINNIEIIINDATNNNDLKKQKQVFKFLKRRKLTLDSLLFLKDRIEFNIDKNNFRDYSKKGYEGFKTFVQIYPESHFIDSSYYQCFITVCNDKNFLIYQKYYDDFPKSIYRDSTIKMAYNLALNFNTIQGFYEYKLNINSPIYDSIIDKKAFDLACLYKNTDSLNFFIKNFGNSSFVKFAIIQKDSILYFTFIRNNNSKILSLENKLFKIDNFLNANNITDTFTNPIINHINSILPDYDTSKKFIEEICSLSKMAITNNLLKFAINSYLEPYDSIIESNKIYKPIVDLRSCTGKVVFSPDGQYMATSGWQGAKIYYFNDGNPQFLFKLNTKNKMIRNITFSNDGKYLLVENYLYKIENNNFRLICDTLNNQTFQERQIFSPDSKYIISTDFDGMYIYSLKNDKIKEIKYKSEYEACVATEVVTPPDFCWTTICANNNFKYIILSYYPRLTAIYSFFNGSITKIKTLKEYARDITISNNNKFIAIGAKIYTFSNGNLNLYKSLFDDNSLVYCVKFTSDDQYFYVGFPNTIGIFSNENNDFSFIRRYDFNKNFDINYFSISPDDRFLVVASEEGEIDIFSIDGSNLKLVNKIEDYPTNVKCVKFSENNNFYATGTEYGDLKIYKNDTSNFILLDEKKDHTEDINSIDFSNDGKYLATGSSDKTVNIYKIDNNKFNFIKSFSFDNKVTKVKFSNNSQYLAISETETLELYSVSGNNFEYLKNITSKSVSAFCFTNDDKQIFVGSENSLDLYSLTGGHIHNDFDFTVESINISKDGKFLAIGGENENLILYQKSASGYKIFKKVDSFDKDDYVELGIPTFTDVKFSNDNKYFYANYEWGIKKFLIKDTNVILVKDISPNIENPSFSVCPKNFNIFGVGGTGGSLIYFSE